MITLAFPGLKEYCEITYKSYENWCKAMNRESGRFDDIIQFDTSGEFMSIIEKRAKEKDFKPYLDEIKAKGFEVEFFDL